MARFIPEQEGYGEHEDRGSKFYAWVFHAPAEEVFAQRLAQLREEHPKARHHCWAWRIGEAYRFSDDGEPGGTAGRPMMQVLVGSGLDDVAAICVRYFGGIKLGTGGLVRAYTAATARALEESGQKEIVPRLRFQLRLPFHLLGLRTELSAICSSITFVGEYGADAWLGTIEMEEQHWPRCQQLLDEKSAGDCLWRAL